MTLIELKTPIGTEWINPEYLATINFQPHDMCFILCGGRDILVSHEDGQALLEKINGKTPAAAPVKTEIRAIVSIECRESYSKTKKQTFKFFTCVMENGEKVNIFDHPDTNRNTFDIAEKAGWFHLGNLEVGDLRNYDPAIPIMVTHDGEWYSLAGIMHHDLYLELAYEAPEREPQDATPDDIPWDSDTSAAVDNLSNGIDFDVDDDEPHRLDLTLFPDDESPEDHESAAYYIDGEPINSSFDTDPDESAD